MSEAVYNDYLYPFQIPNPARQAAKEMIFAHLEKMKRRKMHGKLFLYTQIYRILKICGIIREPKDLRAIAQGLFREVINSRKGQKLGLIFRNEQHQGYYLCRTGLETHREMARRFRSNAKRIRRDGRILNVHRSIYAKSYRNGLKGPLDSLVATYGQIPFRFPKK